jgi:hypothetical protein
VGDCEFYFCDLFGGEGRGHSECAVLRYFGVARQGARGTCSHDGRAERGYGVVRG